MEPANQIHPDAPAGDIPLAIVLDGISEKWQMNVLQVRGCQTSTLVKIDGFGQIDVPAILLKPEQARHLAAQIIEILGPEA